MIRPCNWTEYWPLDQQVTDLTLDLIDGTGANVYHALASQSAPGMYKAEISIARTRIGELLYLVWRSPTAAVSVTAQVAITGESVSAELLALLGDPQAQADLESYLGADPSLLEHEVCYYLNASDSAALAQYSAVRLGHADRDGLLTATKASPGWVGILQEGLAAGAHYGTLQLSGASPVRANAGEVWVPGDSLYLDTGGRVTNVAPAAGPGVWAVRVGQAWRAKAADLVLGWMLVQYAPSGALAPDDLLAYLVTVTWGTQTVVDPATKKLPLQLVDLLQVPIAAAHVVRITCDERATMTVGAAGTALSGSGTSDLIAQTSAGGLLELVLSCGQAATISVAAGPTQASPMLDCRHAASAVFNP